MMTRSYLVLCCLVIWAFLATGTLPSNADSACCARTFRCNLRSDCTCMVREILCRDPSEGMLNSGKRSPPSDRQQQQLNVLESSGYHANPRMMPSSSKYRRALPLATMNEDFL
uniref:Orexin-type 1 n=1 Tax=Asterias rubens TaxID=7604 RepID=A0A0U2NKB1_ASTRU|nr:orexin-type precursor 1 [Asterias rubens]